MVKNWIQKAHLKKGALSKQLGIPIEDNIPTSLLHEIVNSSTGRVTYYKNKRIKVTRLLKHRAQFALNIRK